MDSLTRSVRENDPVLRQATEWALEMWDTRAPVERVAQWQIWLAADERHREAFARVEELMNAAGNIRRVPLPGKAELAADDYDGAVSISAWRLRGRPRTKLAIPMALAATMLLAVMFLAGHPRTFSIPGVLTYQRMKTPVGGTLKVMLTDGSVVDIGGGSSVDALITPRARTITLNRGEAFFRVAKEASRPFTVRAGTTAITAIGTAFNVRRSDERVVVSVAEGAVKVETHERLSDRVAPSNQLTAGQQLSIEPGGPGLTLSAIDAGAAAGWREGRLRYLDEPLAGVVDDVIRYTGRRIELVDPSLGELRITGTVLERNLDGWLVSLEETFPVRARRGADGSIRLEKAN